MIQSHLNYVFRKEKSLPDVSTFCDICARFFSHMIMILLKVGKHGLKTVRLYNLHSF